MWPAGVTDRPQSAEGFALVILSQDHGQVCLDLLDGAARHHDAR